MRKIEVKRIKGEKEVYNLETSSFDPKSNKQFAYQSISFDLSELVRLKECVDNSLNRCSNEKQPLTEQQEDIKELSAKEEDQMLESGIERDYDKKVTK